MTKAPKINSITSDIECGEVNNNKEKPESLYEYIYNLYNGQKPSKLYKSYFDDLKEYCINFSDKENLLTIAKEKDKDNKVLLILVEILLERNYLESDPHGDNLILFMEYVSSHVGNLAKLGNTTIFQKWLDESNGYNKYNFLCKKISEIKSGVDKNKVPKPIPKDQQNILKCVAATWIFHKKHANFEQLLKELTSDSFSVKNQSPIYAEKYAISFLAKMVNSTNRESFSYFLNHIDNNNREITNDKNSISLERNRLSRENIAHQDEINRLKISLKETQEKLEISIKESHELTKKLEQTEIKSDHKSIHQRDELRTLKGELIKFLEQDILPELNSASVANSREPPKSKVVDKKLTNSIEYIGEKLRWMKEQ